MRGIEEWISEKSTTMLGNLFDILRHSVTPRFEKTTKRPNKRKEEKEEEKGHAQRLSKSQRNSASNAKTIGARTAADGEFVLSTTVKASKDGASHE